MKTTSIRMKIKKVGNRMAICYRRHHHGFPVVKNRLPPDKAEQVVAVPHRIGREVGKSALVVHPSRNDQLVLNEVVQSVHNGSGAGNIQLTFDAVDLSFDRHSVGDQAVKDLLQLSHGICAAVGGKLSLVNEEMYLEHLSSA